MSSHMMKISWTTILVLVGALAATACSTTQGNTPGEKRAAVQQMRSTALTALYAAHPEAKAKIAKASGYAVFSSANVNLILASMAGGYGVAEDNTSHKLTYMKLASAGIGLGAGVKDVRTIFIFNNRETLDKFINSGWEFGGHADAAAKSGDKGNAAGGEIAFAGMTVYQITEAGLALQATVTGTKFSKDDELN